MNLLSNIKIFHKIISLMIGLVMGFVLMGVAYYAQVSVEIRMQDYRSQLQEGEQLISQLRQSRMEMSQVAYAWGDGSDSDHRLQLQGLYESMQENVKELGAMDYRYVDKMALANLSESVDSLYEDISSGIGERAQSGQFDGFTVPDLQFNESLTETINRFNQSLATYGSAFSGNIEQRLALAEGEKNIAQGIFAAILLLTAIGTTLGMYLIYKSIVLPLWHVQGVIAQQNRGNTSARVKLSSQDELGTLGRAFNKLLDERIQVLEEQSKENEQLNNSIITLIKSLGMIAKKDLTVKVPVSADVTGTVSDAVNLLTSETARTLHQVTSISAQVNRLSDGLQAGSRDVMEVAEEERQQVAETTSALESLSKAMNGIANEARTTNNIARTAIDNTLKAQASVTETVDGIQAIRGTISETEKRIKRLGDRSQEITGIVNLINSIAERTHILALNASMHAASAGEAGKGFAVVAEEVQRLAENARSATSDISSMVNNIRVETSDTVNIMNKLITQVTDGTRLAEDSGRRMHETESATRQLVNHVKSIAVNSIHQAGQAGQVRDAATGISLSTEKTYEKLKEQQEQTDELKTYARTLVDRVSVFTLPAFRAEVQQTVEVIRQPAVNQEILPSAVENVR